MITILHTPWFADTDGDVFGSNGGYEIDIVNTMGETIGKSVGVIRETVVANAKVQAAAPELLHALRKAHEVLQDCYVPVDLFELIENTIKKATL